MKTFQSDIPPRGANAPFSPGRLLCVTATGSVYLGWRTYTAVPIASAFALLQELALRVDSNDAPVQSSLANRVSGESAYRAWMELSVECAMQLERVTVRGRLRFLRIILAIVRRSGRVDGLETILASAVNAAWPWLSRQTTSDVLDLTSRWLRKSEFAQRHPIPVVDLTQRSAGFFSPRAIAKLDLTEWRTSWDLQIDGADALPGGLGKKLQEGLKSPLERAIDDMFGSSSSDVSDIIGHTTGNDSSGVPGGLPSMGDLPGQQGKKSGGGSQSLDEIAKGLLGGDLAGLPGGLPSLGDLPGTKVPGTGSSGGSSQANSLLDSIPGSEYRGVSGFLRKHGPGGFKTGIFEGATPGGPFAPPGQLGIDGTGGESWDEGAIKVATSMTILGGALFAISVAPAAIAEAPAFIAVAAIGFGAGYILASGVDEMYHSNKQERPDPPKERPHDGDLYPDPMGGGGGNPTQLPAFDGDGPGGPTRLPDSDGHGGGTPNTIWGNTTEGASIWDENFGGPGPTVKPPSFALPALVGPGLMVDLVQVGRSAVRF